MDCCGEQAVSSRSLRAPPPVSPMGCFSGREVGYSSSSPGDSPGRGLALQKGAFPLGAGDTPCCPRGLFHQGWKWPLEAAWPMLALAEEKKAAGTEWAAQRCADREATNCQCCCPECVARKGPHLGPIWASYLHTSGKTSAQLLHCHIFSRSPSVITGALSWLLPVCCHVCMSEDLAHHAGRLPAPSPLRPNS